jgi:hypothetical protein
MKTVGGFFMENKPIKPADNQANSKSKIILTIFCFIARLTGQSGPA